MTAIGTTLYQSYGRTIASEVELALPLAGEGSPPPAFTLSSDREERANQTAGYRLLDLAELTFHEGHHVHLRQLSSMDAPILQHLLVDVAVPTALTAWDEPVLHASAIDRGDGAVLFTGPSGSGKSTLAIAGATRGAQLVADDGVLVDTATRQGVGSITTLRLHEDHATSILPSVQAGEVVTLTGKRRIDAESEGIQLASGPRRVLALFAIDRPSDGGIQITRCGPAEATDVIVRSFFAPPGPASSAIKYLDLASSLAGWLPVLRLEYPRDSRLVDDVLAAAIEAATSAVRGANAP